jgi:transposase
LAFLPSYSPDFNPKVPCETGIERLWRWLKSEYIHNRCWASQAALKADLQQMLLELPKRSDDIKGLMRQELERLEEMVACYETPCPLAA